MTSTREVLVTGAAGFIGRHTTMALHRAGYRVTAVDLRPAPDHLTSVARHHLLMP
jgi:nucleoside-diphosphate-sugar epimerase